MVAAFSSFLVSSCDYPVSMYGARHHRNPVRIEAVPSDSGPVACIRPSGCIHIASGFGAAPAPGKAPGLVGVARSRCVEWGDRKLLRDLGGTWLSAFSCKPDRADPHAVIARISPIYL